MRHNLYITSMVFAFMVSSTTIGFAASPTSFVSGAKISADQTSVEARFGYSLDDESASLDDRFQMRQHIDHGFNDLYALRIITAQDDRKGSDLTHDSIGIENRFQIFNAKQHGWDGGFRLSYSAKDSGADSIGANLIGEFKWNDDISSRHNITASHQVGDGSANGVAVGLRHQVMYKADISALAKSSVGVEMFNDFGNLDTQSGYSAQDHQIGPVMKGAFDNGISFETGYRLGISQTARDHIFKLGVAKSF